MAPRALLRTNDPPPHSRAPAKISQLRYRCHKLRLQIWDFDNKRERFEAHRWVKGHIGESLKTASLEELQKLEGYPTYKLEHGHCPLHEEEDAATRYKQKGGSTKARQKIKEALTARDGERCVSCGAEATPLTLDHIHPIALGGKNELENSQLLCISCHTKKQGMIADAPTGTSLPRPFPTNSRNSDGSTGQAPRNPNRGRSAA